MIETDKLMKSYSDLFQQNINEPSWSVHKMNGKGVIHPSIPFVGKSYEKTRVLLYASAENLTKHNGKLDNDEFAINRHRFHFDNSDSGLFPYVHIAPINNGVLVNVIGYIVMKMMPDYRFKSPRELLEGIAFGNFGKFSIKTKKGEKNRDYAGDINKLSDSLDYIKADLNVLKPEVVILPHAIYKHSKIKIFFKEHYPDIKIISIFQIHHFNINGKNRVKKYEKMDKSKLGILSKWQEDDEWGLKGKTRDNFYSFYTYLDSKMSHIK